MNSLRTMLLFTFLTLVAIMPEALTGSLEEFRLEIPEECKSLGLCEDIPNYPQDRANEVVSELKDSGILSEDTLSRTTASDDTRRVGPIDQNLELCRAKEETIRPKAAVDANGKWHVVVNPDNNPIYQYAVEICRGNSAPCAAFVVFQPRYKGVCEQNYVYEYMTVLNPDGKTSKKRLRIPSNCSCVAKPAR